MVQALNENDYVSRRHFYELFFVLIDENENLFLIIMLMLIILRNGDIS